MLYLGTSPCEPLVRDMLDTRRIGLMCQPRSNPPVAGWLWAADNGCFNAKWSEAEWWAWLNRPHPRSGCLFAVVPDVVADHDATLNRFWEYRDSITGRYPVAFVGQDGATVDTVPWKELDTLFVGGSTRWKLSETAFGLAAEARKRGKWVHVGRVNSRRRYAAWYRHADSCDGTFLAFGPAKNSARLTGWLDGVEAAPPLPLQADQWRLK